MGNAIASSGQNVTATTQSELQLSYASASRLAAQYPQFSQQILAAAKSSFLAGDQWAYLAGLVAVLLGAGVTFFFYPKKEKEHEQRASFAAEDARRASAEGPAEPDGEQPGRRFPGSPHPAH
jgi:hypothetical protein